MCQKLKTHLSSFSPSLGWGLLIGLLEGTIHTTLLWGYIKLQFWRFLGWHFLAKFFKALIKMSLHSPDNTTYWEALCAWEGSPDFCLAHLAEILWGSRDSLESLAAWCPLLIIFKWHPCFKHWPSILFVVLSFFFFFKFSFLKCFASRLYVAPLGLKDNLFALSKYSVATWSTNRLVFCLSTFLQHWSKWIPPSSQSKKKRFDRQPVWNWGVGWGGGGSLFGPK